MFDWLRRPRPNETPEAARRRKAAPPDSPLPPLFPLDAGPSDGCAAHHSGACHSDAEPGFGCDGGASHH
jgi:hypothetical protein